MENNLEMTSKWEVLLEQDVFKIFLRGRRDGSILLRSDVSCLKCGEV